MKSHIPMRRALLAAAGLSAIALMSAPLDAKAQGTGAYPEKPVRFVVPYPPGGITDILARRIATGITALWGNQSMFVDNRAGASGNIGVSSVAKSPPDGYTIVFGTASTHAINPFLFKNLGFDPIKDFEPITNAAQVSNVLLVGPNFPAKNLAELIALAKAKPGTLSFASNSVGSSNHLSGELLKTMAGIDMTHIPYKSSTGAVIDLIGGRTSMMFDNFTTAMPYLRDGRLRAIAVTSAKRVPLLPDVPTMVEAGLPGFVVTGWWGIFAPAGTPKAIVNKLNKDIVTVLNAKEARDYLAAQSTDVIGDSPEHFADFVKGDAERWGKIVKASGATAE